MKLEYINLLEVRTSDGFIDYIDLDQVAEAWCINDFMKIGMIKLKNGLIRCLTHESFKEVKKCLEDYGVK